MFLMLNIKILIDWKDNYKFESIWGEIEFIIKWDSKIEEIKAASIIAKVTRDEMMQNYNNLYPWYWFAKHKWYWTESHKKALILKWACEIHRKSFSPIRKYWF